MKLLIFGAAALGAALAPRVHAQVSAPTTLSENSALVAITTGTGQFASVGAYRIAFSAPARYVITPLGGNVTASSGQYSYERTATNRARLVLNETADRSFVLTLAFSTPTSASYALTAQTGGQSGSFVLENAPIECGLTNMSMRAQVPAGAGVVQGLVIDRRTRVLIRAAGPALAAFGVNGTLSNPRLAVTFGSLPIGSNDDWASTISNYDAVREAAMKAGAFPFNFGSRDAALVLDLGPGVYTCSVSGDASTSGEVLVEIYRVPD